MMHTRNDPVAIEIKTHEHVRPVGVGTTYPPGTTYPTSGVTRTTVARRNKGVVYAVGALITILLVCFLIYIILMFLNKNVFR